MSTDLQFRSSEFQPIRVSTIRITPPRASHTAAAGDDCIQTPKGDHRSGNGDLEEELIGGGCRTPTSLRHKIPEIVSCPPAPKKAQRLVTCKRKLFDVDFFENIGGREEIESFFKSNSGSRRTQVVKRMCPCP